MGADKWWYLFNFLQDWMFRCRSHGDSLQNHCSKNKNTTAWRCVWELYKPAQCLLPSLSLTLYCPLSLSFIFILFAARRPYRSSTRLSAVILFALTRRVLPDAHLEMGEGCISDSSEMHLRMLVLLWVAAFVGDMAPASIRIEAVFYSFRRAH